MVEWSSGMAVNYDNLLQAAIDEFNDELDYSFSLENVVLRCFSPKIGKAVYDSFLAEFGFAGEQVTEEYFYTIRGEAFTYGKRDGSDVSGILLREDTDLTEHGVFHILLHELSHIFCTKEEIPGGHFYDRYCMGSQETVDDRIADGYMNAGYAIWRELAAETVATSIDFRPAYSLSDIRGNIEGDVRELHAGNPAAKVVMVNLLTDVIFSREFDVRKWTKTEATLREMGIPFIGTIEKVSTQLRRKPFYCITPEFISDLGEMYLTELTRHTLELMNL